ncbi:heterokaryon incompatibility protein-domain-containing protein [Hyaloscypha sp. PMI_1271]|nr:heterokaryon incompatibility protein-domain-containing protein [Hyaloscypha sp. PMI_1271]
MYLSPFRHGPHGGGYLPPSAHGGEYVPAEYYKENFSTYIPLVSAKREIRVLSLLPGGADTRISCQLSVKSLDLRPQFEALSYVWGDINQENTHILVNGQKFRVRLNLYHALRHIRSSSITRAIWVDFICINQDDKTERNSQVGLMKDIYFSTQKALIWLGELKRSSILPFGDDIYPPGYQPETIIWSGTQNDKLAVEKCLQNYSIFSRMPLGFEASAGQDYLLCALSFVHFLAQGQYLSDIPFFRDHSYRSLVLSELQSLMESHWWSRIWVVQETVLAPVASLIYGPIQISWHMFGTTTKNYENHQLSYCANALAKLPENDKEILSDFSRRVLIIELIRLSWIRGQPITLLNLLWKFRERAETDPKDKVFALLGLVRSWDGCKPFLADYNFSIFQVFRQVTLDTILGTQSLDVLMGTPEVKGMNLPSWIQDWSVPFTPYTIERLSRAHLYNASRGRAPLLCIHGTEELVLGISAGKVGEVGCVGDTMTNSNVAHASVILHSWEKLAHYCTHGRPFPMLGPYVGGGSIVDAFLRTICLDTVYNGNNAVSRHRKYKNSQNYQELHRITREMYQRAPEHYPEDTHSMQSEMITAIDQAVLSATMHRSYFTLYDGLMGLGPSSTEVGDEAFVLFGGSMPFILRQADRRPTPNDQSYYYTIIGECYIHGMMDGEAMKDPVYKTNEAMITLV